MAHVIDRPANSAPQVDKPARCAPGPRDERRKETLQWVAVHSLAIAAALFFVLPILFVFLTSLMSDQQALTSTLWPTAGTGATTRTCGGRPGSSPGGGTP